MKNIGLALPFLPCLLFLAALPACGSGSMDRQYEQIKASGLSGDALRDALIEFELNNMGHFSSKVDLGGYYLLSGNTERALDYFLRAEKVAAKAPRGEETAKNTSIMYGSLARIYLLQGEYAKAMDNAEKAIAADAQNGRQYRFLQANILTAQNKYGEALALFDELARTQRDVMNSDDIRAFMYLLAKAGRYNDCAAMVDFYFEKGPFFHGLGVFASGAYENSDQPSKAILSAFLDYEYYSSYTKTDDQDFIKSVDKLENNLIEDGTFAASEATIRLLRGLYDNSALTFEPRDNAFFAEDYCVFKKKIISQSLTDAEFERYLQLEPYFTRFPVYYWNVWQAAQMVSANALATYVPALEKIIHLDKDGPYAQLAWEEMTRLMGYSPE